MRLRTARASPFGRKVWISLLRLGLMETVDLVEADFTRTDDALHEENPLGKMPVLTTEQGDHLYDSRVILEYLDHRVSGVIMPVSWQERFRNLRWQSLSDGVMDAGALIVMEQRLRSVETRSPSFVEFQRKKIMRGFSELERDLPEPELVHVGAIALACALGFIERRKQFDWRAAYPGLTRWLDLFRLAAPEYDATYIAPDPTYVSL